MLTTDELTTVLDENWDVLAKSSDPKLLPAMKLLGQHLDNPRSYVTFAGETSSGKSTLINSFLDRKFLAAGAKPTTGTVTWIEYGLVQKERLLAINRDATVEELTAGQFAALSQSPDKNLLRLKAELPGTRAMFKGLSVFDTPGFNAIISEHAEVLKEFLPESDVVVFPVSYKVGFGASDQQLMELIGDIRKHLGTFPVILVVNRAPVGVNEHDKRIVEIRLHAEDTLHEPLPLVIVNASQPTPDGESVLPDSRQLWDAVGKIISSDERAKELAVRLGESIRSFLEQRLGEIDMRLSAIATGKDAIDELLAERDEFGAKEKESYAIVDRYMTRIKGEIPKLLKQGARKLVERAKSEIFAANKWVDAGQCTAYIYNHVLPFCTTGVVREMEEHLISIIEQMDAELDEMANRAVRHVSDRAQTIENPRLKELITHLGVRVGREVTGAVASKVVSNFAGVGGSAAGVGNLVKMGVKKAGGLVGKTFSRELYVQIGKVFTKRAIQVMSASVQIAVELVLYAWDANRWQGQLVEKVEETVDKWEKDVLVEVEASMISEYRKTNRDNVKACYAALRADVDDAIRAAESAHDKSEVDELECDRVQLVSAIKKVKV